MQSLVERHWQAGSHLLPDTAVDVLAVGSEGFMPILASSVLQS